MQSSAITEAAVKTSMDVDQLSKDMILVKELEAKHRKEVNALKVALADAKADVKKIDASSKKEITELRAAEKTRFEEIARLITLLENKESEYQRMISAKHAKMKSRGPLGFVRNLGKVFGKTHNPGEDAKLKSLISIIRESSLFDAEWYLRQYPDVASAGVDPLYHYVKYGAAEGRKPSYEFDVRQYIERFPDVDWKKVNPLVHYLSSSKK